MAENARASPTCNPRGIDMLEVTGSNPGPGKINLIKIEKNTNGIPDSKKVHLFMTNKRTFELV
jgi:hypothetical protein